MGVHIGMGKSAENGVYVLRCHTDAGVLHFYAQHVALFPGAYVNTALRGELDCIFQQVTQYLCQSLAIPSYPMVQFDLDVRMQK